MFFKWKRIIFGLAALLVAISLFGCAGETVQEREEADNAELTVICEEELQYAAGFTLTRYEGGYSMFRIPGIDETRQYLIVPEGKAVSEELSEDTLVIQQPVEKICFASGSLASLAEPLGATSCIKTVAIETDGWLLDSVKSGIEAGEILYSGKFRDPDFEMLLAEGIQLEIDTTMLLNYPEIRKKYDELGIPYFIENSSEEKHPLGRMEWVKLLGAILGMDEEADAWFETQVTKVEELEAKVSMEENRKSAALFYIGENDTVYVRNAADYIPAMLTLAGGEYCMEEVLPDKGGTSRFGFEDFYAECKDADYLFWIVLACPYNTLEELVDYNELFADFKAVQNGNVYSSRRGFAQCTANLAEVILEMHEILNGSETEDTDTFIKLK